jgi:Ca-activated chloride channel family protein
MSLRKKLTLALAVSTVVTVSAQQGVFRSGTRLVSIFATVVDAQKRLVPDLTKPDFEILDNDKPQDIQLFVNEVQPVTVVVMLDTSASMTGNLSLLENASEQFLIRLQPKDKGLVGSFNDKISFFPASFTSDRDRLVRSLKELDFGNPTRLYDAIHASMGRLKDVEGRRVVLVFTDGDDTNSSVGVNAVLEEARTDEVMIYSIGFHSEYFDGQRQVRSRPDPGLRRLSEETGGGYFEIDKSSDLAPAFTRIANELHSQYVLAFSPPALDGKVHKLTVRAKRPGLVVRARKSYVASVETAAK